MGMAKGMILMALTLGIFGWLAYILWQSPSYSNILEDPLFTSLAICLVFLMALDFAYYAMRD